MIMKAYKKRMVEEFNQLKDRANKLEKMLRKCRLHKLDFDFACPESLLERQYNSMLAYMDCLKDRAILEDIDLEY